MKSEMIKWLWIGALLFVVLVASALVANSLVGFQMSGSRQGTYAVFLTNGQTYFGTISSENEKKIRLTNIYYIQPSADGKTPSAQSDVALLKLGNEFHQPEDAMEINQSNVLFVEKLQDSGRVVKAIQDYNKK